MKIRNILISLAAFACLSASSFVVSATYRATETNLVLSAAPSPVPQGRGKNKGRHDRGLHRGWYKGRRATWYDNDRNDSRYARQVYWANGRRYVRWLRYNY